MRGRSPTRRFEDMSPVDELEAVVMEEMDKVEEEEGVALQHPRFKMEEIGDDAMQIISRLANVTIDNVQTKVVERTQAGQPAGTSPTRSGITTFEIIEGTQKRKEVTKLNKVPVPTKKPKGSVAQVEQSAGSGSNANVVAALSKIKCSTHELHLVLNTRGHATPLEVKAIENRNLAIRLTHQKYQSAGVTNTCRFGRDCPNGQYHALPDRVSVVRRDDEDPAAFEGGLFKTLPSFICESCGFTSSKYSHFIFVNREDFKPLSELETRDSFYVVVAQMLKELPFSDFCKAATWEDYQQWLIDNDEMVILPDTRLAQHKMAGKDRTLVDKKHESEVFKECKRYHQFLQKRNKDLRAQACELVDLKSRSAMRACIFCCEVKHNKVYNKEIQVRPDALVYMQTKEWKTMVMNFSTAVNGLKTGAIQTKLKAVIWSMQNQMVNKKDEEIWGWEIKKQALGYLQVQYLQRGIDWVYQLGGPYSRAGTAYGCKNPRCRALPIQSHHWYRVASRIMRNLSKEQFEALVDRIQAKYEEERMPLTEKGVKDVYTNAEWKCPICLTPHGGESWKYESIILDVRESIEDEGEIYMAPFGDSLTPDQQKALNYLRMITLLMEVEEKGPLFTRTEVMEAIGAINHRWGQRLCRSISVKWEKAYDPSNPYKRGYETNTSKELFCISPHLSLPAWGMDVQIARLPQECYLPRNEQRPVHLTEEDINFFLAFCYEKVGDCYPDERFETFVEKSVEAGKGAGNIKAKTVRNKIWEGRQALQDAAIAAQQHREALERAEQQPQNID